MRSNRLIPFSVFSICIAVITMLLVVSMGCTSPSGSPVPSPFQPTPTPTTSYVTVTKPDSSHIVIRYNGAQYMESLIELDATVTDSTGKSSTQHAGDKLGTSPIRTGSTISFEGSYPGTNNHVIVTAFFSDGSQRVVLETYV